MNHRRTVPGSRCAPRLTIFPSVHFTEVNFVGTGIVLEVGAMARSFQVAFRRGCGAFVQLVRDNCIRVHASVKSRDRRSLRNRQGGNPGFVRRSGDASAAAAAADNWGRAGNALLAGEHMTVRGAFKWIRRSARPRRFASVL